MTSLSDIIKDPHYTSANDATKQAIFNKYSATDPNYTSANDATKSAIRQKFGIASPTPAPALPQTKEQEQAALKAKYPLPTGESVTAGMNKLMDLPQKVGDTVFNATGSPALATIAKTASTLIGPGTERAGVKGVEEVNNWVRTMGPKATSEALKSIANKDSTQAGRDLYDLADSIKSMTHEQVINKLATLDPETRNHIIQQMPGTFKSAGKGAIKGAVAPSKALHFLTNKLIDEIDPNVDKTVKQYASWAINIAGQGAAVLHSPVTVGGGAVVGSIIGAAKAFIGKKAIESQLDNEEIQKVYETLDKAAKAAEESAAKKAKSDLATQKVRQFVASKKTLESASKTFIPKDEGMTPMEIKAEYDAKKAKDAAEMPQHTMESGVPKDYSKQFQMKKISLENELSKESNPGKRLLLQRELDQLHKDFGEAKPLNIVGKYATEPSAAERKAYEKSQEPTKDLTPEQKQELINKIRTTKPGHRNTLGMIAKEDLSPQQPLSSVGSPEDTLRRMSRTKSFDEMNQILKQRVGSMHKPGTDHAKGIMSFEDQQNLTKKVLAEHHWTLDEYKQALKSAQSKFKSGFESMAKDARDSMSVKEKSTNYTDLSRTQRLEKSKELGSPNWKDLPDKFKNTDSKTVDNYSMKKKELIKQGKQNKVKHIEETATNAKEALKMMNKI